MNILTEVLTDIPLVAGALSCILSIFSIFVTWSQRRIKKQIEKSIKKSEENIEKCRDAYVKIKIDNKEMFIDSYSTEEVLKLLSRFECKEQTLNQGEEDAI